MILRIIYIMTIIIVLLYGILKKRRLDLIFIYFLSSVLYFFPAIIGQFQSFVFHKNESYTYKPEAIYYKVYIILIINALICFLWMLFKDRYLCTGKKSLKKFILDDFECVIVLFLEVVVLLYGLYMINRLQNFIFTNRFDKTVLLDNMTTLDTFCISISYFFFILAFTFDMRWKKCVRFLSVILIIFPVLLAKRSELVLAVIAIVYVWLNKKNYISVYELLMNNKKILILGCAFLMMVFVSKGIMNPLVQGNWDKVGDFLGEKNALINSFLYSEPNVITSTLNGVTKLNVRVDGESYKYFMLSFFPFIETLFGGKLSPIDYYAYYQPIVYPELQGWGAANCFLAEAYSNGGWLMEICVVSYLCGVLYILETGISKCKNWEMKSAILAIVPYLVFYIHRNTLYYTIRFTRIFVYFAVFISFLNVILKFNKSNERVPG